MVLEIHSILVVHSVLLHQPVRGVLNHKFTMFMTNFKEYSIKRITGIHFCEVTYPLVPNPGYVYWTFDNKKNLRIYIFIYFVLILLIFYSQYYQILWEGKIDPTRSLRRGKWAPCMRPVSWQKWAPWDQWGDKKWAPWNQWRNENGFHEMSW